MKKTFLRIISLVLASLFLAFALVGCKKNKEEAPEETVVEEEKLPEKTTVTRAEWLSELVNAYGYPDVESPETPYFTDIAGHQLKSQIEKAAKFGLIDITGDVFIPDANATREFATVTAVRCMGFVPSDSIECTDIADITYPEYAKLGVDLGLFSLNEGMFYPKKDIHISDKTRILNVVKDIKNSVSGPTGDEEGFVYKEDVVALSTGVTYSLTEEDSRIEYLSDGRVKVPYAEELASLQQGQIVAIDNKYAFKVVSVELYSDYVIIEYTEPDISEVLDKLDIAGTAYADASKFQPADDVTVQSLAHSDSGELDVPLEPFKKSLEVKLTDSITANLEISWSVLSAQYGYDIDFKYLIIPQVNNAYLVFNHKVEMTATVSSQTGEETTINGHSVPLKKRLGSIPFVGTDNFGIVAEVYLVVSAEGTFNIEFEVAGSTGAQIVNNIPRLVNDLKPYFNEMGIAGELKAGAYLSVVAEIFHWDIISFSANLGMSAAADIRLRATGMLCMDFSLAPYLEVSIFEDTVIDEWFDCAKTSVILKNDDENPFQKRGHLENFNKVAECTYKELGTIFGTVVNAENHGLISNAKISIYDMSTGQLIMDPIYSDAQGEYSVRTQNGKYKIVVSADGFIPFEITQEVRGEEIFYVEALLMVEGTVSEDTRGTVGGTIKNSVTGDVIPYAKLSIRKGWNKTSGNVYYRTTADENGYYQVTLPLGNYTVEVEKDFFITSHFNVAVAKTENLNAGCSINPEESEETVSGDLRIVLSWGATPSDLDSHLIGPKKDSNGRFHIDYTNKNYYYNDEHIVNLDVDDTTSYGPETITVYSMNDSGTYSYYVHDYTNRNSSSSTAMSNSGAYVQLYMGDRLYATYYIPVNKAGTVWHVFDIDASTGRITPVNEISNTYPS